MAKSSQGTSEPVATARRRAVLLVQASSDDGLDMYAEFLRSSGLAPIAVSNATDALTFAPEADVIVTGILLDGHVDGVEFVSRLRGDDRTMHKPIIVLTTCTWPQERERAEHAGCDVFLSKPCLPDALLREVRLLLPTTHARLEGGAADTTMPRIRRVETSARERGDDVPTRSAAGMVTK